MKEEWVGRHAMGIPIDEKLMRDITAVAYNITFDLVYLCMRVEERAGITCFYRVEVLHKAGTMPAPLSVVRYGLMGSGNVAPGEAVMYDGVDSLPGWMQRKLAVLVTIPFNVPTEELDGIGRRVSEHVFWVYECPQDGDTGGTDTRKKGKSRRQKTA